MIHVTGYKVNKAKQAGAVRKMTQTQAARVLGVSRGHLNRVIHGARLSRQLTVLFSELLTLHPKKTKSKT